jgi:hypothetical protein
MTQGHKPSEGTVDYQVVSSWAFLLFLATADCESFFPLIYFLLF